MQDPFPRDALDVLRAAEPGEAVLVALQKLLGRDADLLGIDANERSITHRFASYLQDQLSEWQVDCEYNRDGHNPKRVALPTQHPTDEDTEAKTVFPDVIAHRRGTPQNYLVIEFKKLRSRLVDHAVDLQKLRAYKDELHYAFALFIAIGVGESVGRLYVEWIP